MNPRTRRRIAGAVISGAVALVLFALLRLGIWKPKTTVESTAEFAYKVAVMVTDQETRVPISDARVTFHSREEFTQSPGRSPKAHPDDRPTHAAPGGTSAPTGADGRATLSCKFGTKLVMTYDGKKADIIDGYPFPTGRFLISRPGYATVDRATKDFISEISKDKETVIHVTMRPEPAVSR